MNQIAQLGRLAAQQQKQAFDVSRIGQQAGQFAGQMANKGLQSPIGQGVLGAGANLYNKMPQGGRDWISNQAIKNFSRPDDAQGFPQRHGFNRDPSLGTGINATTTVEMGTKPDGNAYDKLDDRISSMTPGHAGSPLGQVLGGIMSSNSRMPTSTFPQGTPVANQFDVHNANITADKLVPRSMFDQQYGGQPPSGFEQLIDKYPGAAEAGRALGVRNSAQPPAPRIRQFPPQRAMGFE